MHVAVPALLGRGVQGQVGIVEVRPRERAQVGPARDDDRVDVVPALDVADGHGRDARQLVADPIAEGGLEHAPVDRLGVGVSPARGHVDERGAVLMKQPRGLDGLVLGQAAGHPVRGRDPHGHRLLARPDLAAGVEDLEREAHAALERAAVVVAALVGQR